MKKTFITLSALALFTVSCNNDSSGHDGQAHAAMILEEKFNENCETVRGYIDGLQNENSDYSQFSESFYRINTSFRAKNDTVTLTEFIDSRVDFAANYDVELITEPVFLPGVLGATGEPNGSVRYYSEWRITKPASESSEAKDATLKLYESFDFDDDGKISVNMVYGDFSAMFQYLDS